MVYSLFLKRDAVEILKKLRPISFYLLIKTHINFNFKIIQSQCVPGSEKRMYDILVPSFATRDGLFSYAIISFTFFRIGTILEKWGPGRDSNPSHRIHSPIGWTSYPTQAF